MIKYILILVAVVVSANLSFASSFEERRTKFQNEMKANLNSLEKEIIEVKTKISNSTDKTKQSLNEELDRLEANRLALKNDLQKSSDKSEKAWDEVKGGFSKAWGELKTSFQKAKEKLK